MKVLIVTHNLLNNKGELGLGGVQTYASQLIELLIDNNINATVFQLGNFSEKKYKHFPVKGFSNKISLRAAYEKNELNYNLVIFLYFDFARWCTGKLKYIAVQHGVEFDGFISNKSSIKGLYEKFRFIWHYRLTYPYSSEKILNKCSIVCVDTNWISWVRYKFPFKRFEKKIHFIPNTVKDRNEEKFHLPNFNKKMKLILIPRRLEKMRGINFIVPVVKELMSEVDDLYILFAGHGSQSSYIINELNCYRNRFIVKGLSQKQLKWAYLNSYLVLIPTLYSEGSSISTLEALKFGVPSISSNVGGLNDIIIDGFNGYKLPLVKEVWVNKIKQILNANKGNLIKISSNGKEVFNTSFNLDMWKKSWIKLILDEIS